MELVGSRYTGVGVAGTSNSGIGVVGNGERECGRLGSKHTSKHYMSKTQHISTNFRTPVNSY